MFLNRYIDKFEVGNSKILTDKSSLLPISKKLVPIFSNSKVWIFK